MTLEKKLWTSFHIICLAAGMFVGYLLAEKNKEDNGHIDINFKLIDNEYIYLPHTKLSQEELIQKTNYLFSLFKEKNIKELTKEFNLEILSDIVFTTSDKYFHYEFLMFLETDGKIDETEYFLIISKAKVIHETIKKLNNENT